MLELTNWVSIVDKVTTGEVLSNQLNTAFTNIDTTITKVNEIDTFTSGLLNSTSTLPTVVFSESSVTPNYLAGLMFYKGKEFKYFDGYSDQPRTVNHSMYMEVINTSGASISKGKAVRHNGVSEGVPQIILAKADTLEHATILGVTAVDIPVGEKGIICTFGEVFMDTSALPAGVPLYLSDTLDGDFTATRPDIITQVGGITVQSLAGTLMVSISNSTADSSYVGVLSNLLNSTVSLTTTSAVLTNYSSSTDIILTATTSTGDILLPYSGIYKADISVDMSFITSTASRTLIMELYNTTTSTVTSTFNINIPRDSVVDSRLLSKVITATAGDRYVLRVKGSTAFDITFNSIDFVINSVNI